MIPGDKAYYPGTAVLQNKFDIRDFAAAQAAEYKFASVREIELRLKPIEGKFDFDHLKAIHKHLFQDVYKWAGEIREIDFSKRNKDTDLLNKFVPTIVMDIWADKFNKFMTENNQLKGLTKPEFVKALTEVHTQLNEMHPFREGNGRSTRVFLTQLAKEAGYELNLTKIDKDRWNLASHKALPQYHHKTDEKTLPNGMDMRQIFHEALKPTMAHAFKHETRAEAVKHYPELGQVYDRIEAISRLVAKFPDPEPGRRVIEAEKARILDKLSAGIVPPLNPYLQGRMSNQTTRQASMAPASVLAAQAAAAPEKKAARLRM